MSIHESRQRHQADAAGRKYCVQLYAENGSLCKEYYLDANKHHLPDLAAAERFLQQTLTPSEVDQHVSVSSGDMLHDTTIVQFKLSKSRRT